MLIRLRRLLARFDHAITLRPAVVSRRLEPVLGVMSIELLYRRILWSSVPSKRVRKTNPRLKNHRAALPQRGAGLAP